MIVTKYESKKRHLIAAPKAVRKQLGVTGLLSLSYRNISILPRYHFLDPFPGPNLWLLGLGFAFFGNVRRGLGKSQEGKVMVLLNGNPADKTTESHAC